MDVISLLENFTTSEGVSVGVGRGGCSDRRTYYLLLEGVGVGGVGCSLCIESENKSFL